VSQESLRELLGRVHERLSQSDRVDAESRELLVALTHDIDRALGGEQNLAGGQEHPAHRLEELAVRFEAEHPALARALRQLMDALGKAGI
jgi:hypothetical protein